MKIGFNPKGLWPGRISPAWWALILAWGVFFGLVATAGSGSALFLDSQCFPGSPELTAGPLTSLMAILTWFGSRAGSAAAACAITLPRLSEALARAAHLVAGLRRRRAVQFS